jgi:hypothetical protein
MSGQAVNLASETVNREPVPETAHAPCLRRWPFFSTPLRAFLAVMVPILAFMILLALVGGVPTGIRWTALAVIAVSLYAFWRGYLHRLEITGREVAYHTPLKRLSIPWSHVCRIDRYTPPDRNPSTQYVYITRLDHPPPDRFTINADTLQLQDRPGLLEALQGCWRGSASN